MYNKEKMKKSIGIFLDAIGHPIDENTKETPERCAKMWKILLGGYDIDPSQYLKTFPAKSDDMVTLTNIPFYSFCSHHLVPFIGKLHIAYIPNDKVVGISKLVRFARVHARRLQLQEDLTQDIADELMTHLNAKGVIVRIEASHLCTIIRGIRSHGAVMVTNAKRGIFKEDVSLVSEFNDATKIDSAFSY
jgi:GTP cyclohydrolase I